jgi:nucleotidyltransferase/DNA polymerase involved in DNA repair
VKSTKDCPEARCAESALAVSWRAMTRKALSFAGIRKRPERKSVLELHDLVSVGPATVRALHSLGVRSIAQLARSKPKALYEKLCRLRRQRQDQCCLDVFSAAVAQARNPNLPAEKRVWWYWSRQRKAKAAAR